MVPTVVVIQQVVDPHEIYGLLAADMSLSENPHTRGVNGHPGVQMLTSDPKPTEFPRPDTIDWWDLEIFYSINGEHVPTAVIPAETTAWEPHFHASCVVVIRKTSLIAADVDGLAYLLKKLGDWCDNRSLTYQWTSRLFAKFLDEEDGLRWFDSLDELEAVGDWRKGVAEARDLNRELRRSYMRLWLKEPIETFKIHRQYLKARKQARNLGAQQSK